MSRRRLNRRSMLYFMVGVLAFAIVATAAFARIADDRTHRDQSPPTIDALPFNALVEAEVLAGPSDGRFSAYSYWVVRLSNTIEERGTYFVVGGAETPAPPLVSEQEEFVVAVPATVRLEPGASYLFYMHRPTFDDPAEQARWNWQAELVVEAAPPYAPAEGTNADTVASLDSITLAGETRLDSMIEFSREFSAYLDTSNRDGRPALPDRLRTLRETRGTSASVQDWLVVMAQRDPASRQLPGDAADLQEYTAADISADMGIDEWTPWRMVVVPQDVGFAEVRWVAVLIEGVGFLGPYGVEPDTALVEIHGYGPTEGRVSLLLWDGDEVAEIMATPTESSRMASTVAVDSPVLRSAQYDLNANHEQVSAIVDLRSGVPIVGAASPSEITALLEEVIPTSEPRAESGE